MVSSISEALTVLQAVDTTLADQINALSNVSMFCTETEATLAIVLGTDNQNVSAFAVASQQVESCQQILTGAKAELEQTIATLGELQ